MIIGVTKKPIPYVLEDDRKNKPEDQTVFWIMPKKGHDANVTLSRYAGAGRDGRKGYRELSPGKLDNADVDEFLDIIKKVEHYQFSEDYTDLFKRGPVDVEDAGTLQLMCKDLSPEHLNEIFDAANNLSHLQSGEKKTPAHDVLRVVEKREKG